MRNYLAETLGTFMLVFAGCGAIIIDQTTGGTISHLGISLVFGLVVLSVIYAYGDISGAHINPAVTIGFWAAGRFPLREVFPYAASQLVGASLACFVLKTLIPGEHLLGATLPSGTVTQTFWLEVILSWWLMVVILGVSEGAKEKGIVAGMVIGSVVMLEAAFGGPISGASMNPARSFGPALVSGTWQHLWIYFAAPIFGCILATFTCKYIGGPNCCAKTSEKDPLQAIG